MDTELQALLDEEAALDAQLGDIGSSGGQFRGGGASESWNPPSQGWFADAVNTYAPKVLKAEGALPDMAIGAVDYLTGDNLIPDNFRIRNAVDWLANGQERDAETSLGKAAETATDWVGTTLGGGALGKGMGLTAKVLPKIPLATKALSGLSGLLQADAKGQIISSLLGAGGETAARELGADEAGQRGAGLGMSLSPSLAKMFFNLGKAGVRGVRNLLGGEAAVEKLGLEGAAAEYQPIAAELEKQGADLGRPVSDLQDLAEQKLRAAGQADNKIVSPENIAEMRGENIPGGTVLEAPQQRANVLRAGAEEAKATEGAALQDAKDKLTQAFESLSHGDKAKAWRTTRNELESLSATLKGSGATEEQLTLAKQIDSMVAKINGKPLKNGASALDKQIGKWESPSMGQYFEWRKRFQLSGNPQLKEGIAALDTIGDALPEGTEAVRAAKGNFRVLAGDDSAVGKMTAKAGALSEPVPVTYAKEGERIASGPLSSEGAMDAWLKATKETDRRTLIEKVSGDLLQKSETARETFIQNHITQLKKLFKDPKAFYAFKDAMSGKGNTLAAVMAKQAGSTARFVGMRMTPAMLASIAGGGAGAMSGDSGPERVVLGIAGMAAGGRLGARVTATQLQIAKEVTKQLSMAGSDPRKAALLAKTVTPKNLKQALKALGLSANMIAQFMSRYKEEQPNENTDMGTKSFPKKKLTSEPMTTSKSPEAKLAPVSYSPDLVKLQQAVIGQESGGNPTAMSRAGAQGLMQLMPETGKDMMRRLGLNPKDYDPYNPDLNKQLGTEYLRMLRGRYDGDIQLALAAYNWGMGNLEKAMRKYGTRNFDELVKKMGIGGRHGMPLETAEYVPSVLARLHKINTLEV